MKKLTLNEAIKKRLLYYLEEKKIKLSKLCLNSGLTPSTGFEFMYGNTKVLGLIPIAKLCEGLGITLEEFFSAYYFKNLDLPE